MYESATFQGTLTRAAEALTHRAVCAQRGLRRRIRQRGVLRLDADGFAERLCALGLGAGRTVLVHSGWGGLSQACDLPATIVLDVLRAVLGPTGTLMMPAYPFLGSMTEYLSGLREPVAVRRQPARTGLLCELLRRTEGVVHSLHPTHPICALGQSAEDLTAGHLEGELPFGPQSPYARLANTGGLILGLGVNYRWFSAFHLFESCFLNGPSAKQFFEPAVLVECVDERRGQWIQQVRPFRVGVKRCFFRAYLELKRSGGLREAYHGNTAFLSIEAAALSRVLQKQAARYGAEAVLPGSAWRLAERFYLTEY